MKKFAAALGLSVALFAGAASGEDMMQSAYANTLAVTLANGAIVRYHFNADGSFDVVAPDGSTTTGAYAVANGQICLTPTGAQAPTCAEYVGVKNVGDTWTQAGGDGSQVSITIVAGRP